MPPTENSALLGEAAEENSAAQIMQNRFKKSRIAKVKGSISRLGINSRNHWVLLTIAMLFVGKGVTPFVNDAIHATQTSLVDDPALNITESTIGQLSAISDLTEGLAKLTVAPALAFLGPRNAWLIVLGAGTLNVMLPPITKQLWALYNLAVTQYIFSAWAGPATTMVVAGWVDGHQLGKALGFVAVATKVTPSIMFFVYGKLMGDEDELDSWTKCFKLAGLIVSIAFVVYVVFLRSNAKGMGFSEPTPPGSAKGSKSKITHPLAHASTWEAFKSFICMKRTWALMAGFSLLVILKGGAKFASIYAKHKLHATNEQGSMLQTTYAISATLAGICGGFVYDIVPGGKIGIGCLMSGLNVLNLCGFLFAFISEITDSVTMGSLYIFMAIIGFASVLPVSLVFAIYSMAIGGVRHCGTFVAAFEFVAHFTEAALDLWVGEVLENEEFGLWLGVNCCIALAGTIFMALCARTTPPAKPDRHSDSLQLPRPHPPSLPSLPSRHLSSFASSTTFASHRLLPRLVARARRQDAHIGTRPERALEEEYRPSHALCCPAGGDGRGSQSGSRRAHSPSPWLQAAVQQQASPALTTAPERRPALVTSAVNQ